MKKNLHFGFMIIILFAMAQWAQTQMPAAISIDPPNATGWDELTLTLDANVACHGAKQSIVGQSDIRMHSAAFLYDNIANWGSQWGSYAINFNAQPKEEGFDFPRLTDNGDGTYSITFTPSKFYGVPEGSTIIGITAVFNANGGWDYEAKDFAGDVCGDFYIPLSYEPPTPALKFTLDLTYQEELGNFDRATGKAYVIVNGTEYEMDQLLIGIVPDARYEKLLTEADDGITAGTSYSYKFKMDDTEETVERDPVVAGNYQMNLTHFFNDVGKPVADVRFIVDMRYASREGIFNPETNYVDIAGSLNGWDGTDYHLTDENSDTLYEITVEEIDLLTIIEYKYRIDGSWDDDKSEFPGGGPNRHATVIEGGRDAKSVWNNTIPGTVPVIFSVNMNNEIAKGTFVARENYVDVAGSMNGWGDNWNDELYDQGGDGIYVTIPAAFAPIGGEGDTMEYKFRMDSSWDDLKSEFPGGGPNRKYVVLDTTGGVVNELPLVWFNDVGLGIHDQPIRFQEISFYPNPVTDIMYIENKVDMQRIMISNILGQEVLRMELENRRTYELNAGGLERGLYILSVYGEKGYVGTAKFIKQ
jgi:hypothetical protein